MFLRHFQFNLFFHVLLCPSFRLICFLILFSCYVSSLFPVYPYFMFFPRSVMFFFPSLICSLSFFCFLVCLSSFPLFPPVSICSVHPRCLWQLTSRQVNSFPLPQLLNTPQQMYLEHLRVDHSIWPFQEESGRHARLVSTSHNTVGLFCTQTVNGLFSARTLYGCRIAAPFPILHGRYSTALPCQTRSV